MMFGIKVKYIYLLFGAMLLSYKGKAEDGYNLWLRYDKITNKTIATKYQNQFQFLTVLGNSPTLSCAAKEIQNAFGKMLDKPMAISNTSKTFNNTLVLGTISDDYIHATLPNANFKDLAKDGYILRCIFKNGHYTTIIASKTDIGVLYGSFKLLELLQLQQDVTHIDIQESPKIQYRLLNHWDNLDGTIERGYAGYSIWDWQRLPGIKNKRYVDYARANASIGINGTVLNNVNSSVRSLTKEYLVKTAALADIFRPYGIKIYLTAKFSAPKELGKLPTADPLDPAVIRWWKEKADEIYQYIPDFGGFLVKANSEGQPGPGDYGRTHADGANMMAKALQPHHGIVIWRTFVYENEKKIDRAAQGYQEFKPLDGKFDTNVIVQAKYGPIDFQPREAFNPLFGAMPKTNLGMEFQVTQEYFGFATHLVYLGPLFQEYLSMQTHHAQGSIADVITAKNMSGKISCISGVSNIGTDINWCGHPFAQSNWYAFGKFAWNPYAQADTIADNWIKMTFTSKKRFVDPIKKIMMDSREAAVDYMEPMGLNHIMNLATHYGPGPWGKIPGWNSWDYHRSDSLGIGFDRTDKGANTTEQYANYWREKFNDINTTPLELLLWFHHVPWNYKLPTGKTMWNELVGRYYAGTSKVKEMQAIWNAMQGNIDKERFEYVAQLLTQQYKEASWWRDGCVLYFQTYSNLPISKDLQQPSHNLNYYEKLPFPDFK